MEMHEEQAVHIDSIDIRGSLSIRYGKGIFSKPKQRFAVLKLFKGAYNLFMYKFRKGTKCDEHPDISDANLLPSKAIPVSGITKIGDLAKSKGLNEFEIRVDANQVVKFQSINGDSKLKSEKTAMEIVFGGETFVGYKQDFKCELVIFSFLMELDAKMWLNELKGSIQSQVRRRNSLWPTPSPIEYASNASPYSNRSSYPSSSQSPSEQNSDEMDVDLKSVIDNAVVFENDRAVVINLESIAASNQLVSIMENEKNAEVSNLANALSHEYSNISKSLMQKYDLKGFIGFEMMHGLRKKVLDYFAFENLQDEFSIVKTLLESSIQREVDEFFKMDRSVSQYIVNEVKDRKPSLWKRKSLSSPSSKMHVEMIPSKNENFIALKKLKEKSTLFYSNELPVVHLNLDDAMISKLESLLSSSVNAISSMDKSRAIKFALEGWVKTAFWQNFLSFNIETMETILLPSLRASNEALAASAMELIWYHRKRITARNHICISSSNCSVCTEESNFFWNIIKGTPFACEKAKSLVRILVFNHWNDQNVRFLGQNIASPHLWPTVFSVVMQDQDIVPLKSRQLIISEISALIFSNSDNLAGLVEISNWTDSLGAALVKELTFGEKKLAEYLIAVLSMGLVHSFVKKSSVVSLIQKLLEICRTGVSGSSSLKQVIRPIILSFIFRLASQRRSFPEDLAHPFWQEFLDFVHLCLQIMFDGWEIQAQSPNALEPNDSQLISQILGLFPDRSDSSERAITLSSLYRYLEQTLSIFQTLQ